MWLVLNLIIFHFVSLTSLVIKTTISSDDDDDDDDDVNNDLSLNLKIRLSARVASRRAMFVHECFLKAGTSDCNLTSWYVVLDVMIMRM